MSISGIGSQSTQSLATSTTKSKADETIQQLADEGDPVAIAELKAEQEALNPTPSGASEPGKGQNVDTYV